MAEGICGKNNRADFGCAETDAGKGKMYTAKETRYDKMKYNRCGRSGLMLPAVSLGLWHNFGSSMSFDNMCDICQTAFDNGITQFDLANNYGPEPGSAEENFGRVLKKQMAPYRDEMIISTKAGYDMWKGPYGNYGSRKYLIASLDQSLLRMGLEYVDIFYHHRPDSETPMEETMLALDQIVRNGKALYVGISNYNKKQTEEAIAILRELKTPFVLNQRSYSMLNRSIEEEGLKEYAVQEGFGIIAFSPLAQGLLTDRYLNGIPQDSRVMTDGRFLNSGAITKERLAVIRSLNEIACRRGQSLAQMALSWNLREAGVTSVIIGASKPAQVLDNIQIVNAVPFTVEELAEIDAILQNPIR